MSSVDGDVSKSVKNTLKIHGDWLCSNTDCKNLNFARRTQCNRCGRERERAHDSNGRKKNGTEIGKVAAEKSRGLFNADDWICGRCSNVNWQRRKNCNVCSAPKVSEVEERTGYGGGYNDRGVVEYKEHRDSDNDEYDEFGRRKRKHDEKRTSHRGDSSSKRSKNDKQEDSESEEDSEDDDDDDDNDDDEDDSNGDLSKYQLFDDETDADKCSSDRKKSGETHNIRSRRSRSKSKSRSKSRSFSSKSSSSSTSYSSDHSSRYRHRRRRSDSRSRSRSRSTSRHRHNRKRF